MFINSRLSKQGSSGRRRGLTSDIPNRGGSSLARSTRSWVSVGGGANPKIRRMPLLLHVMGTSCDPRLVAAFLLACSPRLVSGSAAISDEGAPLRIYALPENRAWDVNSAFLTLIPPDGRRLW